MSRPLGSRSMIAVMTPGDMGSAVAQRLINAGLSTVTCLAGRSARTQDLAKTTGIETVADFDALVEHADVILSILVPSAAATLAGEIADAASRRDKPLVFVEFNAVAPATVHQIGMTLAAAGIETVDGALLAHRRVDLVSRRVFICPVNRVSPLPNCWRRHLMRDRLVVLLVTRRL